MAESYETYAALCRAQDVRPASRANWEADIERRKPHTVDFLVTEEMAKHGELHRAGTGTISAIITAY